MIWSFEKKVLNLKVNWKLSRNQTTVKENILVNYKTDFGVSSSEVAPNIRYGETLENIFVQIEEFKKLARETKSSKELLARLDEISLKHSLRFALESCLISDLAKSQGQTLTQYLGLPAVKAVPTSFSMPIIPLNEIEDYLKPLSRFKSLKIKVNAETGTEMLAEIRKHTNAYLRVDANEGWTDFDAFMKFQETLKGLNIDFIEQPFPSHLQDEYRALKKQTPYVIMADESIEDVGDFQSLSEQFHAINVKLMKTGSLLKARDLLMKAKAHQMKTMIGCMIETTIGISYGMLYSGMVEFVDLDGFLLVKDEPFHLVSETEGILKLD